MNPAVKDARPEYKVVGWELEISNMERTALELSTTYLLQSSLAIVD
jgi:hypothetical protein